MNSAQSNEAENNYLETHFLTSNAPPCKFKKNKLYLNKK